VSALTDRLTEDNLRELARLMRETHARTAARLERERQDAAGSRATVPQRARLWAGLHRLGLTPRGDALATVSRWVGREIRASGDLTAGEARTALDAIGDGDHDAA
jgi:hypothetical protein